MAIQYALFPNPLTSGDEDQRAMVQNRTGRTKEDIIDEIISRGSTITKAEALAVIEEYEACIAKFVAEGDRVNTSLMNISSSIAGVFTDKEDYFDEGRHQININVQAGPRLQKAIAETTTQKVPGRERHPQPKRLKDFTTDSINSELTPGGSAELNGTLLKYDHDDNNQGIFLIASDGTESRVEQVLKNWPSLLLFVVPDNLSTGKYSLEVRSVIRRTTERRRGALSAAITIS
ncbi:DNA-binding domain-containing protein [Fodinibius sp. Rm-B-1B1-1]|uniref:DNA-binding domain-containing protein n=1 Tax=Fodinibius alkaliphilus TaxID=3140241 RepID=UPI003159AC3F